MAHGQLEFEPPALRHDVRRENARVKRIIGLAAIILEFMELLAIPNVRTDLPNIRKAE